MLILYSLISIVLLVAGSVGLFITSLISIVLLVAGSVGLFITYTGSDFGSTIWLQGTVTYGAFIIIAVAILVGLLTIVTERD